MSEENEAMDINETDTKDDNIKPIIKPNSLLEVKNNSDTEDTKDDNSSCKSEPPDSEEEKLYDELYERAEQLEKSVCDYDAYNELISIYKQVDNKAKISETFKKFNEHFPLTAIQWLQWIECEKEISKITLQEQTKIIDLFENAVNDCESVDIWLEFAQFSIGATDNPRAVFERGLEAVGMHVSKGSLLYDAYREYELAILSCTPEEEWEKQVKVVVDIYSRQFKQVLSNIESVYSEWKYWIKQLPRSDFIDVKEIEENYFKSLKILRNIREFEDKLLLNQSEIDEIQVYHEYMQTVPYINMKISLYQRATNKFILNDKMWLEYVNYLYKCDKYDFLEKVCNRAVKLCNWNEKLWEMLLRISELNGKSQKEITKLFELSLVYKHENGNPYLTLWTCYLEHFIRNTDPNDAKSVDRLQKVFNQAIGHVLSLDGDSEFKLVRLWARIEAQKFNNMQRARELWREYQILEIHGSYASMWLELIELEQKYGIAKHVRKFCMRALDKAKDWPQSIIESWKMYERLHGSIKEILECEHICDEHLNRVQQEYNSYIQQNVENFDEQSQHNRKRKQHVEKKNFKRQKVGNDSQSDTKSVENFVNNLQIDESKKKTRQVRLSMDTEKQKRSVFVSNLDYRVTEEELMKFLGNASELSLVKNHKGESRGYGYVVFNTKEEAEKALARDRERFDGRPVFISKCRMDKEERAPQFKYPTSLEKHKLFVRGLPYSLTEKELEDIFKPHGELQAVRLVVHKSGQSKGLGYVEFKNASDATKAIIALDNTELNGHKIFVAISAPPKRNVERYVSPAEFTTPKNRLQIPLVPRSVKLPTVEKPVQPSLSNTDFRQMLLNKK